MMMRLVQRQLPYLFIVLSVLVLVECSPLMKVAAEEDADKTMNIFRLPDNVEPKSYNLRIWPTMSATESKFTFEGQVSIVIKVKKNTKTVYLHCNQLENLKPEITQDGYQPYHPTIQVEPHNQLCKLEVERELVYNNEYTVDISFEGKLKDDMVGFYRSYYQHADKIKWLASTQFEPTYARNAFPCFDEPGFKTPFTIIVGRYPYQKAISNMPLKETSAPDPAIDNRVWDTFQTTPPMSTYLVAFIVSEFTTISNAEKNVFVHARPNAIDDTKYSLKQAEILLERMENFTGVKYDLPKLDLVAVPDFQAGAMENWGLTTYRERFVMYNEDICPEKSKEVVTSVIAHELSHQWFGDYVTPTWWDHVWLNEAFATYFEDHIVTQTASGADWRMNEYFVIGTVQTALFGDQVEKYHAMTSQVKTPTEIKDVFDIIIYQKGGSVIRMLEHIVTTATFKKALTIYLTRGYNNGGSVTPSNLWDAFNQQIYRDKKVQLPDGQNIVNIMGSWVDNRGYPLITAKRVENGNLCSIIIEQETYKSPRATQDNPDQEWFVPITYTKKQKSDFSNTLPMEWSKPRSKLTLQDAVGTDDWFVCNIQQTGYYRVNYDDKGWQLLITQLQMAPTSIHPLNRAQLIDDAFSLAIDHKLSFDVPLKMAMKYLPLEDDPIPWFSALNKLRYLYNNYESTVASTSKIKNYIIDVIHHLYKRLGFEPKLNEKEDHLTKTLRSEVVKFACSLDIDDCVIRAKNEYSKNSNNLQLIQPNIKEAVLCTMLNTDQQEAVWNNIWQLYKNSNVAYEKETVLMAAGCAKNENLLDRYLHKLLDERSPTEGDEDLPIRPQYRIYVTRSVLATQYGVNAAIKSLVDMKDRLSSFSQNTLDGLSKMAAALTSKIITETQMKTIAQLTEELQKQSEKKYAKLIKSLNEVKAAAEKLVPYHTKTANAVATSLDSLKPDDPTPAPINPTQPTHKPTSAASLTAMPSLIMYIVAAAVITTTFTNYCATFSYSIF